MAEGGFLVKFDGKKAFRCWGVSIDYDTWSYRANAEAEKPLPGKLKKVEIVVEGGARKD